MKSKFLALTLGLLASTVYLSAQPFAGMGNDTAAFSRYQALYQEHYRQTDFRTAMPYWVLAQKTCPSCSKSLYIHGVKMFEEKIQSETESFRKDQLIDSLLWVYDTRIACFGDDPQAPKGYVLGMKGIAIQKFRKQDYKKGYAVLGESIGLMGTKSSPAVILTYMQASQQLFRDGAINDSKAREDYETSMGIIKTRLKINPDDQNFRLIRDYVEKYYADSGAASNQTLEKLHRRQSANREKNSDQ